MSESSNEQDDQRTESKQDDDSAGISDEQLPEDLVPSEDNPLAEPLTEEDAPEDMDDLELMGGGSSDDSESSESSGDSGEKSADDTSDESAGDGESQASDDEN